MYLQVPQPLSDSYKCVPAPENVVPVHENLFAYSLFRLHISTRLFNFNFIKKSRCLSVFSAVV